MKFPLFSSMTKVTALRSLVLLTLFISATALVSAQKGGNSILLATTDTDACQNGARNTPELPCSGTAWSNGNLNINNSQWVEGEYVPVRIKISALVAGSTGNTVTIDYDTTTSGKHTFDWLGDYDASTGFPNGPGGNDPCSGVSPCASPTSSPIPADPNIPGTVTQPSGRDMTIWNGTITNISMPAIISGDYTGTSITRIVVTYDVNPGLTNVVIAFGAHVGSRLDWGLGQTAINLNGSPYHLTAGGGQVSMKVDATIFPSIITIIKSVSTLPDIPGDPPGTTSTFSFGFTYTQGTSTVPFSLVDDVVGTGPGSPRSENATEVFQTINFGAASPITITENDHSPTWTFGGLSCTSITGGLPVDTTNNTPNPGARSVTIVAEESELTVCTFTNTQFQPTAAHVSISGRTVDSFGNAIGGTRVTLTNAGTGESVIALTNPFGYYTLEAEVGNFYIMSVSNKRYTFSDNTRTFSLNEELSGVDFVADPRF
jgi:hypothetical protein